MEVTIVAASAKVRAGPAHAPGDGDDDAWSGVIPVTGVFGEPIADQASREGVAVPASVRRMRER